jgi:hypothetical protein
MQTSPLTDRRIAGATRRIAVLLALGPSCVRATPAEQPPDVPIADPIPQHPAPSGMELVLEELVTMPRSSPVPAPADPRLVRWARINYLGEVPDGSGRLFVPDLNGKLYLVKDGTPREYLDLGARFSPAFWSHSGVGTGFGFVAFHPDFARNGLLYTVHTEAREALVTRSPDLPSQDSPSHQGVLTEWKAADPSADGFVGTSRELLRLGFRSYIHGFQQIDFNPTSHPGDDDYGLLYLAVGDGGAGLASGDPQNLGMPQGKILRIDPQGTSAGNGKYGVPPANPFVGRPGALGEIYAYGLRNPHRFSWDDRQGRRLFVGNIGEHNIESIYQVDAGDNLGWPGREGPFRLKPDDLTCSVFPLPGNDGSLGYTYPVAGYDHHPPPGSPRCADNGEAVIGGFVYRGGRLPDLDGQYLFGDDVNGRIFHSSASEMRRGAKLATVAEVMLLDAGGRRVTMQDLAGGARVDLRFGRDAHGELYLLSKANGKIWKVTGAHR